jgi:elongation factor Tu
MLYKKFSKTTTLILFVFIMAGLACDNSGSPGSPGRLPQNEPSAIEPGPEEATPVPVEPETPDLDALADEPFLMPIDDIFTIPGRGTVIVGTVERGPLEADTELEIVGVNETIASYLVTGIEQFNKEQETAVAGQQVGLLLRGVPAESLQVGQVAAAPGSIAAHYEFAAAIQFLSVEEGGPNRPIFTSYRPQIRIWTLVITGQIILPDDVSQLLPGEEANVTIELIAPAAFEIGTTFDIMDNESIVGTGVVTEIIR